MKKLIINLIFLLSLFSGSVLKTKKIQFQAQGGNDIPMGHYCRLLPGLNLYKAYCSQVEVNYISEHESIATEQLTDRQCHTIDIKPESQVEIKAIFHLEFLMAPIKIKTISSSFRMKEDYNFCKILISIGPVVLGVREFLVDKFDPSISINLF